MICNEKMRVLIAKITSSGNVAALQLPNDLSNLLSQGFCFDYGGVFLKHNFNLYKNVSLADFQDLTGYESYINKVNIDDFVESQNLQIIYETSSCFIAELEKYLRLLEIKFAIVFSVQEEEVLTANVRFYTIREGEHWLDLTKFEQYEEALSVILYR